MTLGSLKLQRDHPTLLTLSSTGVKFLTKVCRQFVYVLDKL